MSARWRTGADIGARFGRGCVILEGEGSGVAGTGVRAAGKGKLDVATLAQVGSGDLDPG